MGRRDAKRVKNLSGMGQLIMDINPERIASEVYINEKIDVTNLIKYMEKKKKENNNVTLFHAFVTAMAKTIYSRPKMNYFIANRHLYKHNDLVISFVAKIDFNDKSEEMMILIPIEDNDNIDTISQKIFDKVEKIRNSKDNKVEKEGANSAIDIIGKIPNFIRVPLVGTLKWFSERGMLPKSLQEDDLYFSSVIVSNLGSIECGAIYHHLTNFGTCSTLVTIGEVKEEEVIKDGQKELKKLCEFGITLDERVADGVYFAKAVKILAKILQEPELLEEEVSKIVEIQLREKKKKES